MNCFNPVQIDNPYYGTELDFYGHKKIFVPCGHCAACIVNNANEWRTRLEIEYDNSETACFVTLTYDDTHLPIEPRSSSCGDTLIVPVVRKRDIQLFLKRLRQEFKGSKIRYFVVSEYGPTTFRPHYHGLFFGIPRLDNRDMVNMVRLSQKIAEIWNNGHVKVDSVTHGRIAYCTKYMSCVTDLPDYLPKPFRLMSRRPGIGLSYMEKRDRIEWHRINLANYYPSGEFKRKLPRYLKDKIFDDAMKFEISKQSKLYQDEKERNLSTVARSGGYSHFSDSLQNERESFERSFNKRMKKNRKDI